MLFSLLIIQSLVVHGKQRNTGKKSRMMEVRLPSIWPTRTARCTHAHVHKQLGFDRFASYLGAVNIGHLRGPPPCTLQNCHLYNLQSSILKSYEYWPALPTLLRDKMGMRVSPVWHWESTHTIFWVNICQINSYHTGTCTWFAFRWLHWH